MATYIFGGMTAIMLVLSVWIHWKNNEAFEEQVQSKENAQRQLAINEEDLTKVTELRDGAAAKKQKAIEENALQNEELLSLGEEIESIEVTIVELENDSKFKKIAAKEEKLDALPDPDILIPDIESTKKRIATLKTDIQSSTDEMAEKEQRQKSVDASVAYKREVIQYQREGKSLPTLSTTLKGVYSNWGFVTLNAGNAQGVVAGSILDVLREGEPIAKLKVTAVEKNRAVADILLDSASGDAIVSIGDRVVAEGSAK